MYDLNRFIRWFVGLTTFPYVLVRMYIWYRRTGISHVHALTAVRCYWRSVWRHGAIMGLCTFTRSDDSATPFQPHAVVLLNPNGGSIVIPNLPDSQPTGEANHTFNEEGFLPWPF